MSLIVEDGTGRVDAEAYCTTSYATQYLQSEGRSTDWEALAETRREQCLRMATRFMTATFRENWKGRRTSIAQALDWPRAYIVLDEYNNIPFNTIPAEIKNACTELALRASIGPLIEDLEPRVIQETIGPITVKYDPNSVVPIPYLQVRMMLKPFLGSSSSSPMVKLVRC